MILADNILTDERIAGEYFECDLEQCKGACCTFPGEFGAPVLNEEVQKMNAVIEPASKYLSEKSKKYIETHGAVQGEPDKYSTVCIDKRDCVFVYYENDIALCAIEKAFFAGEIDFRKPISCHLFPIREVYFGGKCIHYEQIDECAEARVKGKANNNLLYKSLKEALVRAYGEQWYNEYVNTIESTE